MIHPRRGLYNKYGVIVHDGSRICRNFCLDEGFCAVEKADTKGAITVHFIFHVVLEVSFSILINLKNNCSFKRHFCRANNCKPISFLFPF